jgi:hypothetical protein
MSGGFLGISPPNFFLIASSCPEENIIMFSTTSRVTLKKLCWLFHHKKSAGVTFRWPYNI